MPRNSSCGLICILVLVACLGLALPAAAAPAERISESPLLSRLWDWAGNVWETVTRGGQGPWTVAVGADNGNGHVDRGILIDPNGNPGGK